MNSKNKPSCTIMQRTKLISIDALKGTIYGAIGGAILDGLTKADNLHPYSSTVMIGAFVGSVANVMFSGVSTEYHLHDDECLS